VQSFTLALILSCCALHAAVVWQDPAALAREDKGAPAPPFRFDREETGGTSPKVVVKDARGVTWYVKFGFEAKPETLASRIVRSAGYFAPIAYFVPKGQIQSIPAGNLKRADKAIDEASGRFTEARFSREVDFVKDASWTLDESSIKGSRELSGLKLLIMLTSNWDIKDPNFAVVRQAGQPMFAITDWGQTFGAPDMKTHWNCRQYSDITRSWLDGVEDGHIYMRFGGKMSNVVTNGIRVEHARWLLSRISGLTEPRLKKLLRSAGATPEESACFSTAITQRITSLRLTVPAAAASAQR